MNDEDEGQLQIEWDGPTKFGDLIIDVSSPFIREACKRMAPQIAYGRHRGPIRPTTRIAAVSILLLNRNHRWITPLTVRSPSLSDHAGQVSFPGGRVEQDESIEQAARRELFEELGVPERSVQVVGRLSPVYVFASDYLIHPILLVSTEEIQFRLCPQEVTQLLLMELPSNQDAIEAVERPIVRGSTEWTAPGFLVQGHFVWGATAIIAMELVLGWPVQCNSRRSG